MASGAIRLLMLGDTGVILIRGRGAANGQILPCVPAPDNGPAFQVMRILEAIDPRKSRVGIGGVGINLGIRSNIQING